MCRERVLKDATKDLLDTLDNFSSQMWEVLKVSNNNETKQLFEFLFRTELPACVKEQEKRINAAHQRELFLLRERLYNATKRPTRGVLKNISKSSGRNLITPVTSTNSLAMAYTNSKLSNDQ